MHTSCGVVVNVQKRVWQCKKVQQRDDEKFDGADILGEMRLSLHGLNSVQEGKCIGEKH